MTASSVDPKTVCDELRHRLDSLSVTSPLRAAKCAVELVRAVVSGCEWNLANDLLSIFKLFSERLLLRKDPLTPFVRNVTLRCLKVIRDDYKALEDARRAGDDYSNDSERDAIGWDAEPTYDHPFEELKERLLESLNEVISEIDLNETNIGKQASHHVHSNDVILTVGHSPLVETFLRSAWKKGRSFHVVVVEGGHKKPGHRLAEMLEADGVGVTIVPDSSVFAVMSNINKVVLGTHILLANGGLRAVSGTHAVCMAARYYAVPVLVCTSSHELVPEYPGFAENISCDDCQKPFVGDDMSVFRHSKRSGMPFFFNPTYDYVPPEMVSILIFSSGGNVPSYMYSLRNELYSPEDVAWEVNPNSEKQA